jgi:hypothetical protein
MPLLGALCRGLALRSGLAWAGEMILGSAPSIVGLTMIFGLPSVGFLSVWFSIV